MRNNAYLENSRLPRALSAGTAGRVLRAQQINCKPGSLYTAYTVPRAFHAKASGTAADCVALCKTRGRHASPIKCRSDRRFASIRDLPTPPQKRRSQTVTVKPYKPCGSQKLRKLQPAPSNCCRDAGKSTGLWRNHAEKIIQRPAYLRMVRKPVSFHKI